MADYTDGQGWSKLDATSARHLAQVISTFRGASRDSRTQMLLYCFSQLQGNPPYFRCGVRTIAKECEVTPRISQRFLEFCEREEIFKLASKTKRGETPKRTFFWLDSEDDRCNQERLHPVTVTKGKRLRQCNQNTGSLVTHQIQSIREGESSKSDLSPRASSVCADAPTDARQKEQPPTNNELEEKEHGFVDTKDIQPDPDAIGVPQDEFDKAEQEFQKAIDEALAKNSFTGANKADFAWRDYRRSHKPVSGDV